MVIEAVETHCSMKSLKIYKNNDLIHHHVVQCENLVFSLRAIIQRNYFSRIKNKNELFQGRKSVSKLFCESELYKTHLKQNETKSYNNTIYKLRWARWSSGSALGLSALWVADTNT